MFATLADLPRQENHEIEGVSISMATQSKSTSNASSPKAGATKAKSGAKQARSGATQVAHAERNQAQRVAEAAAALPVGAVLRVTDRFNELDEPFTARDSAERKIRAYQAELRRSLKRTERRGATARRRATTEARKTRNRV